MSDLVMVLCNQPKELSLRTSVTIIHVTCVITGIKLEQCLLNVDIGEYQYTYMVNTVIACKLFCLSCIFAFVLRCSEINVFIFV